MKPVFPGVPVRAVALAICAFASAASASAAPTVGPAGSAFYDTPASLAGSHGDLISYRSTTVSLGTGAPSVKAWNVLYQSTDSLGAANAVTGTVLVPTTAWSGSGSRPVVLYAVGTQGLAQSCAPSLQMAAGTEYENANIAAALKAGYAVLVSDYAGYTNGKSPTYLAGASQGHAVLDIFKAATQIPSVGIAANTKVGIWGYSQGGQTAAFAGEQLASYAPGLNVVGVAAGGVPADFKRTAKLLNGGPGAFFLLGGVIGLAEEYPNDIPLNDLANANGQATIARGKSECVFEGLFDLLNHNISEYVVGNQSLDQLVAIPSVSKVLDAQNLGKNKIPVPLYQYHGQADEFIPLDQDIALKKNYCSKFANVTFAVYPGEHIMTQFQAAPYVTSWLADRFNGKFTLGNCIELAPEPKSTANPSNGNFLVSLKDWKLGGTMVVKNLNSTVVLPDGAKFGGNTELVGQRLTDGSLTIPDFMSHLTIAGLLPIDVKLSIKQVAPATGTAMLDKNGQLHVHGSTKINITLVSVGESILQLPTACTTATPVDLPLDFDGPVSSLGNGNLTFSGVATFPQLSGCGGIYGPLLSAFFSGAGQKYSFTVSPPAPINW